MAGGEKNNRITVSRGERERSDSWRDVIEWDPQVTRGGPMQCVPSGKITDAVFSEKSISRSLIEAWIRGAVGGEEQLVIDVYHISTIEDCRIMASALTSPSRACRRRCISPPSVCNVPLAVRVYRGWVRHLALWLINSSSVLILLVLPSSFGSIAASEADFTCLSHENNIRFISKTPHIDLVLFRVSAVVQVKASCRASTADKQIPANRSNVGLPTYQQPLA
jgi:hypothetical protein